jgi:DNA integrity scanning protein DisA with diadenylate cyclase activity
MAERTDVVTPEAVSLCMIKYGAELARDVGATVMLISADVSLPRATIREALVGMPFRVIMANRGAASHADPTFPQVTIPQVHLTRPGQVKAALLIGLARGLLKHGDRVVCLSGVDGADTIDAMIVLTLGSEPEVFSTFDADTLGLDVEPEVFERLVSLATQLAAEGREGRPVGALFVIGDSERVLPMTRSLVLNPFRGYPEGDRNILDPRLEETIKEFSAIDGAFIIRGDGVVLAAGVQLLPAQAAITLPTGLGTRHAAAAAITASTNAVATAISQSTGAVTIFREGRLVACLPRATGGGHLAGWQLPV